MDQLPLEGIKVVDFSNGIAGPYAGLLCSLHGADVVKIEPTGRGDWGRLLGKTYGEFSAASIYYNRGKRSLSIDLRSPEGRAIAYDIASKADIVIEAFRPGVMKRLGLDFEAVKKANDAVIYLSVTGFGPVGSKSGRPATDAVVQAYSGMMMLNKDRDGNPRRFPMIAIDVVTGLYGFNAISAALIRKLRFGGGQHIQCSMMQSAAAFQALRLIEHSLQNGLPDVMYVPLGPVKTKDGYVSISVQRDEHFVKLCGALERQDLASHPRYEKAADRIAHEPELMAIINAEFMQRTTDEWGVRLTEWDVLHAPIRTYDDVLGDAELGEQGVIDWLHHNGMDKIVPIPNVPGVLRTTADEKSSQAPRIGEHSRNILDQYGRSASEIDDLIARQIVHQNTGA